MSWESKTDYCGLSDGTILQIKSSNENRGSQYLEKLGQNGAIAATKLYGTNNASPSCEYTIKKAGNVTVQIGKITTVDNKRYALQQVVYTTGAGQEPTLTATSVQVESTTDGEDRMFEPVTLAVDPEETAQVVLSAATVSGDVYLPALTMDRSHDDDLRHRLAAQRERRPRRVRRALRQGRGRSHRRAVLDDRAHVRSRHELREVSD